jgi:DNA-binding Lrp family transcriptional regulator
MQLDRLDVSLLTAILADPKAGARAWARQLEVARGTAQTRIARLLRGGAIRSWAPELSPADLGFPVLAFVHLHLAQGNLDRVGGALVDVPEVTEAHTIAGEGDMLCRVVARDSEHLEDVIQRVLAIPGVVRSRAEVALSERVPRRTAPLLGLIPD